jgi:hypothetical protein
MMMRLKDIAELIKADVIDLTEGPFHVTIQSDDLGAHIVVQLEFHQDSQRMLNFLGDNYPTTRTIVMKIPKDSLAFTRIAFKRRKTKKS